MRTKGPNRRDLLRLTAGGLALVTMPMLRRIASGAPGTTARARRLLVLNLAGGVRSSAGFLAATATRLNPWGVIPGVGGAFALGRLLDDTLGSAPSIPADDYQLGPAWRSARVPRFREIAGQFSVVGTWSTDRGYHARARLEEPSGDATGVAPGLLTRVAAGLTRLAGKDLEIPAFHLTPRARFGGGNGAMARYVPVELETWTNLPSVGDTDAHADLVTGHDWSTGTGMRERFDRARVASRAGLGQILVDTVASHRRGSRIIGSRLAMPDMAVGLPVLRAAALGTVQLDGVGAIPLTNAMLAELFTRCLGPGTYEHPSHDDALDAALAVRLLQLGSPAVTLELGSFDLHSGERQNAPPLYAYLGRLWAALRWLLPRLSDPSGEGSLFDRTLVVTMSDFGRDAAGPTGWNAGEGSDHGNDPACFYLAHAVMGAGIAGGRLIGGVRTDTFDARGAGGVSAPPQLLATMLAALGLDPADDEYGLPHAGPPIEALWS
jgi:uncharacterized protein (DUF1501 family)